MNENKFENENMLPIIECQGRKFVCLPNQTEMTFPDGTVYRVNSLFVIAAVFASSCSLRTVYRVNSLFVGKAEMGRLLDALDIEKIDREVA